MRIIAQRCLYGVDKNPLAAEMAKLSLWLLTLAKDKPFEFLDHSIRCGDSLVGLHSIDQLRHFSLKPDADDAVLFKGPLDSAVDEAINLRLKLEDMPANTVEDVERQEKLLKEANEKIARLRCAADLLVAAEFWGESAKDKLERVRHAADAVRPLRRERADRRVRASRRQGTPGPDDVPLAAGVSRSDRQAGWVRCVRGESAVYGWADASHGNSGTALRYELAEVRFAEGNVGNADLCAYFFLRASHLVRTSR